jgi:hypothetical protein
MWRYRGQLAAKFLILFVAIRTLAMTQLQTVEPRYVIECFPVIVALGALAWTRAMPARGENLNQDLSRAPTVAGS